MNITLNARTIFDEIFALSALMAIYKRQRIFFIYS